MPSLVKPSRLAAALRAEAVPQGGLLTVSAYILFDFESPRRLLTEQALWPMVVEQMPPGAIFDKGNLKPVGEVIVAGAALAPFDTPVTGLPVVARLGSIEKSLNVFGDRFWRRTDRGVVLTQPVPFDRMPIDEAHAFGGPRFAENPRGKGHDARAMLESGYDAPLPNVENPQRLIRSPDDQVRPAHFGPIAADAAARMRHAGTYDQAWIKNRMPMKPDDFNPLFHCDAPEDQRLDAFFSGDERFTVSGMSRGASMVGGVLPNMVLRAFVHRSADDSLTETRMVCDTVTLFPNITKAVMTFRGLAKAQDPLCEDIGWVMLACEHREDQPRSAEYYQHIFRLRTDPEISHKHALSDFQLMPLRDEAEIGARRAARIERARQQQRTFTENQDWLMRKTLADQGISPTLAPATEIGELADLPVVAMPTREEIERGDLDVAEILDDVEALSQAIAAKTHFYTARAELTRRAAVKATPPAFLLPHMLKPLATDEDIARYPDLAPLEGTDALAFDISQMRPDIADEDFSRRVGPAMERFEEALASLDIAREPDPQALEEQFEKACARALNLPEASMLHDARREIGRLGPLKIGEGRTVAEDEPGFMADIMARMDEISARPIAEFAPGPTPEISFAGAPEAGRSVAAIAEGTKAAGAQIARRLPGVAAEAKSDSLEDVLAALIAGLPAAPSEQAGQTFGQATAARLADASQQIENAEVETAGMLSAARHSVPAAIFPLEPLAPTVAERLGAFIAAKLAEGHDFPGADLAGAHLPGLDLRGRPLRSTFFERCDLRGTDFSGADLEQAVFSEADLEGANFTGARIAGVNLSKARLGGARFDGCALARTTLIGVDFTGASFRRAQLSEVTLIDCQLDGADFSEALLADFHILRGQADGLVMAGAEVARGVFIGASMKRAVFRETGFQRTTFVDLPAQEADFARVHLEDSAFVGACDLTGCMFAEAVAVNSSWNGTKLGRSCFLRATLNRTLFNGCDMTEADLRLASFREGRLDRSILTGSDLFAANLYAASLAGCDLTRATMRGANLYLATLDGAKLGSADLTGANLGKTILERPTDA